MSITALWLISVMSAFLAIASIVNHSFLIVGNCHVSKVVDRHLEARAGYVIPTKEDQTGVDDFPRNILIDSGGDLLRVIHKAV